MPEKKDSLPIKTPKRHGKKEIKQIGEDVENPKQYVGSSKRSGEGPDSPKLLRIGEESCIFKIPESMAKMHHKGYEPEIVSIGPYHHNKEHLKMTEEHKPRYLQLFLAEAAKDGVTQKMLENKILDNKNVIRNCYSEKLVDFDQEKLVKMMLLDGCFILMLIFLVTRKVDAREKSPNDPILNTPWILSAIRGDLLLLENQVPFILLEVLFKESKPSTLHSGSLIDLAFKFFNFSLVKDEEFWTKDNTSEAKHLLDLIRKTFIPVSSSNGVSHGAANTSATDSIDSSSDSQPFLRLILSTTRLRLQGIKFKASLDSSKRGYGRRMVDYFFNESHAFISRGPQKETILDIQIKGNEIHIPPIAFDEFISLFLLNCVAFEQLSMKCSNSITSYVVFMGCLLSDEADANYLTEKGIIENYFGNGNDVSQFFRNIRNGVAFDLNTSYLKDLFIGINKYTAKRRHVECARFMRLHFDSPWACMSSSAVLAILLLTIIQATFAVLSYFHPPKQ